MRSRQCKRCATNMYDSETGICNFAKGGINIINVIECSNANDGKGGVDRRFEGKE